MIDKTKRTTLKALSGITAAAAIPASVTTASAAMMDANVLDSTATGTDVNISMVSGHGRWHSVKLTNTSNKAVAIKHVYPGIVAVDGDNYDINSVFRFGAIVIEPGQSHVAAVAKQNSALPEIKIPQGLTRKHPFSLTSQYQHFGQSMPVVTTRSFFA